VLVEGGPTLLRAFFVAGLVDQVAFFYAPKVLAGKATRLRGAWRRIGADEIVFEGSVR
jgi:riboflavin biosynthesis pyrimidine reductase